MIIMRTVEFLKLHGLGNDFILIDERAGEVVPEPEKGTFSSRFCDRHRGIGGDGVLFLGPREDGVSFRIFNSDGSEADMCVNGLRCASLALRLKLDPEGGDQTKIFTRGGVVTARILALEKESEGLVEVQTGFSARYQGTKWIEAGGKKLEYHLVDVGNPHAVTFLEEDVSTFDVEGVGHAVEYHREFQPERVNTEFVNRIDSGRLKIRVHERGACETLACGSGAIAAAKAAQTLEPSIREWVVQMPGGALDVIIEEYVTVRGKAALSFEGRVST